MALSRYVKYMAKLLELPSPTYSRVLRVKSLEKGGQSNTNHFSTLEVQMTRRVYWHAPSTHPPRNVQRSTMIIQPELISPLVNCSDPLPRYLNLKLCRLISMRLRSAHAPKTKKPVRAAGFRLLFQAMPTQNSPRPQGGQGRARPVLCITLPLPRGFLRAQLVQRRPNLSMPELQLDQLCCLQSNHRRCALGLAEAGNAQR